MPDTHIRTREESLTAIRKFMPGVPKKHRAYVLLFWGFKHRNVSCCAGHCAEDMCVIQDEFKIPEPEIDKAMESPWFLKLTVAVLQEALNGAQVVEVEVIVEPDNEAESWPANPTTSVH